MDLPENLLKLKDSLKPNKHPGAICVANYKGGVGKTTVSCLLGYQLAHAGHNILLIDIDPQCSLSLAVGFRPHEVDKKEQTIHHLVQPKWWDNIKKVKSNKYPQPVPDNIGLKGKMHIIKGSFNVDELDSELTVAIHTTYRSAADVFFSYCRNLINSYISYDYIIIDCPPNKMYLTQGMLRASAWFLTVTIPDQISIYGMPRLLKWVKKIPEAEKPKLLGVVLNAVNRSGGNPYGTINQQQAENGLNESVFPDLDDFEKEVLTKNINLVHLPKLDMISKFLGQGSNKDAWFEFRNSYSGQSNVRTILDLLEQRIKNRINSYA